jgi:putative sterol carrier protein
MANEILDQMKVQAANVKSLGARIKFLIDDNPILIDGNGEENVVTAEDEDADCVIICSADTLAGLKSGDVNPMMAVMTGKVKIKGDMGLAMKLQSLI